MDTRKGMNKILGRFCHQGLLTTRNGHIVIHDAGALRTIVTGGW